MIPKNNSATTIESSEIARAHPSTSAKPSKKKNNNVTTNEIVEDSNPNRYFSFL